MTGQVDPMRLVRCANCVRTGFPHWCPTCHDLRDQVWEDVKHWVAAMIDERRKPAAIAVLDVAVGDPSKGESFYRYDLVPEEALQYANAALDVVAKSMQPRPQVAP